MAEHSKLPWQVDEDYPNCIQSSDDPNIEICECSIMVWDGHKMHTAGYGQDEVNAALIVRAVNALPELTELLAEIASELEQNRRLVSNPLLLAGTIRIALKAVGHSSQNGRTESPDQLVTPRTSDQ